MRAIAGGGRYDNLGKLVSGGKVDLPALGFGMGDVVLADLLHEKKLAPKPTAGVDIFVIIEDEALRGESLGLVQRLREAEIVTEFSLTPAKSDKQFKRALELNAAAAVRCVIKDSGRVWVIRDLRKQTQTETSSEDVLSQVRILI